MTHWCSPRGGAGRRPTVIANILVACTVRAISGLGLKVAAGKTEAVFMHGGNHGPPPETHIVVGDMRIRVGSHIKYLGLLLDERWRFGDHILKLAPRLDATANALSRLMPNLGGPSGRVRRLYGNVLHSIALYGAPIWATAVSADRKALATLRKTQKRMAVRVTRAYRTVSHAAATLLAGMPPVDILAEAYTWAYERIAGLKAQEVPVAGKVRRAINAQARKRAPDRWKETLAKPGWGRRTVQAILPHMEGWLDRTWARASYRTSQVLTGHGCCGQYLRRIGKEAAPSCHHCGDEEDTAQHTLEACPAWAVQRHALRETIGEDFSLEAVVGKIVREESAWSAFSSFCEGRRLKGESGTAEGAQGGVGGRGPQAHQPPPTTRGRGGGPVAPPSRRDQAPEERPTKGEAPIRSQEGRAM
ncbi:PREDICTED: uncharacterized protein LOC105556897 [Vollenhovia emeryi]|uniref:uncharacterized protein LOC105556897 n=1 Tax=Vollenhovia emeryi TaxID=411798 RepID=UPI0005F36AF1|nr:PREDICTED: uncharacterized protein LOC105556897 [Vollenhovia emeryi]